MVVLVLLRGQHPISPLTVVKPTFGTQNQKFAKLFVELGSSQGNPLEHVGGLKSDCGNRRESRSNEKAILTVSKLPAVQQYPGLPAGSLGRVELPASLNCRQSNSQSLVWPSAEALNRSGRRTVYSCGESFHSWRAA